MRRFILPLILIGVAGCASQNRSQQPAVANPVNPIAALDLRQTESIWLQRFTYPGLVEENGNGIVTVHSGGQIGSYPRGNPCLAHWPVKTLLP
jgi:hypothetical protein